MWKYVKSSNNKKENEAEDSRKRKNFKIKLDKKKNSSKLYDGNYIVCVGELISKGLQS